MKDIRCANCGATTLSLNTAHRDGWTWFTGYLADTQHFCDRCIGSRRYDELLAESTVKPPDYPLAYLRKRSAG